MSRAGELIAEAEMITSLRATAVSVRPQRRNATPVARRPSKVMRSASAPVIRRTLWRFRAGRRKAFAADQRRDRQMVMSIGPKPSWRSPL